jgi:hypothetical protein
MPYVTKQQRERLDGLIKKSFEEFAYKDPGEINYFISSILWRIFKDEPRYSTGNMILGILEAVKLEFYRRQLAALEERKIQDNGDLDLS